MQAGVITEDNFPQLLRSISQRRRSGILEVHDRDSVLEIVFYVGRIVDLSKNGSTLLELVVDRLKRRDLIDPTFKLAQGETYATLIQSLRAAEQEVDSELINICLQSEALDNLYQLKLESGSYYNFRIEAVAANDSQVFLSLSVGEILLDLVSLRDSDKIFEKHLNENQILVRGLPAEVEYTKEQQDLIWMLREPMTVSEMRLKSILSRLLFDETLLSLYSSGAVVREDDQHTVSTELTIDNFDLAIDEIVEHVTEASYNSVVLDTEQSFILNNHTHDTNQDIRTIKTNEHWLSLKLRSDNAPDYTAMIFLLLCVIIPLLLW